jgi:hypothetical protein
MPKFPHFLCNIALVFACLTLGPPPARAAHGPILFIGDSQSCETFGSQLDQLLRYEYGDLLYTHARWGSSPHSWLTSDNEASAFFDRVPGRLGSRGGRTSVPLLAEILSTAKPTTAVIQLGGNLHGMLETDPDFIGRSVLRMVREVRDFGAACIWIGPAQGRLKPRVHELYARISRAVGDQCLMINSVPKTWYPPQGGDGLHFDSLGEAGRRIGLVWAQSVFEEIQTGLENCRHNRSAWCPR